MRVFIGIFITHTSMSYVDVIYCVYLLTIIIGADYKAIYAAWTVFPRSRMHASHTMYCMNGDKKDHTVPLSSFQ